MKKLDTIILSIGAVALIAGLALMIASESPSQWGIACFALAGIALLGELLFYILSALGLCCEKAEDKDKEKKHQEDNAG